MEDTNKEVKGATPDKQKVFRLNPNIAREGVFTLVTTGKSSRVFLNHGTKAIAGNKIFPDGLPAADQAILKSVYDAGPEMVKFVIAPEGYKAPWAK